MTLVRTLAICTLLAFSAGHVSGQQQSVPAPGEQPPAGQQPGGQDVEGVTQADAPAGPVAGGNVEHGRYLVERVAMCGECHSTRDTRGRPVASLWLRGGPMPVNGPQWAGEDWPLYIPRIAGLPGYSDEQAMRLLTQGSLNREGRQLRPPMPRFRMTPEDAAAVIAYLRTR
jgi:mono/diheme cytochrome c family protein